MINSILFYEKNMENRQQMPNLSIQEARTLQRHESAEGRMPMLHPTPKKYTTSRVHDPSRTFRHINKLSPSKKSQTCPREV